MEPDISAVSDADIERMKTAARDEVIAELDQRINSGKYVGMYLGAKAQTTGGVVSRQVVALVELLVERGVL